LGKIVTGDGIAPDPAIIDDLRNFAIPKNSKQVERFLGLCGVYQNFIKDYQLISEPLRKLTHKDTVWKWETLEQKTFQLLIDHLCSDNILRQPDFSKDFLILSDASAIGAGAVLCQEHNGILFPVSFASWLFSPTQRRYSTTEREMLGLVMSVRKWKSFFIDRKFMAKTDHKALTGIMNLEDPYGRIARWMAELGQFSFKLNYIPGPLNVIGDTMSRTHVIATVLSEVSMLDLYEVVGGVDILSLPTDEEWAAEQRADPEWYPYIRWIQDGSLPKDNIVAKELLSQVKMYALYGDHQILVRVTSTEGGEDPSKTVRKVVPTVWRKLILTQYHDSMFRGTHAGRDKTLKNISAHFYFKNMAKYVEAYVKSCHICQKIKNPVYKDTPWSPLGNIQSDHPWDLVCIDLWSPGVRSRSGNVYELTIIDAFSKFALSCAIPNKEAETIARALWQMFGIFGMPKRLHSDLGKEFVNEIIQEMCDILGIEKSNTTAYHPQGNAYAERIHQFFRQSIASYSVDDYRNWDEMLAPLMLAYNDSYHEALGCTPSEVFFGRRLGVTPPPRDTPVGEYTELGFARKLEYILAKTHALVFAKQDEKILRNKRKNEQERLKRVQNMSAAKAADLEPTKFAVGDRVMLYRPKVLAEASFKLSPHWYGPFVIDKVGRHDKFYYLKDPLGDPVKYPVSILRLKQYHPRENEPLPVEKFPDDILSSVGDDVTSLDAPRPIQKGTREDEDTQDANLEWNNPEEEFVPIINPPPAMSQEEAEVLQGMKTGKHLKTRGTTRRATKTNRYKVVDPKNKSTGGRKKIRQGSEV
jgi:transposase InsO family protein